MTYEQYNKFVVEIKTFPDILKKVPDAKLELFLNNLFMLNVYYPKSKTITARNITIKDICMYASGYSDLFYKICYYENIDEEQLKKFNALMLKEAEKNIIRAIKSYEREITYSNMFRSMVND